MKQFLLSLVLTLGLIGWTSPKAHAGDGNPAPRRTETIRGSGRTVVRELPAASFHTLHTSRSVQVTLTAEGDKIRIEADDNVIDHVLAEQDNGTLTISLKPKFQFHNARIRVTVPTDGRIREMKASSSSGILCEVPLTGSDVQLAVSSSGNIIAAVKADKCTLTASSSGDIHAGVSAAQCAITASSSGDITATVAARACEVTLSSSADVSLSGEADECRTVCSSSADFNAGKFTVKRYDITVSSSADANIYCTEHLMARASSSGSIDYTGNCSTDKSASSGGSIDKN